MPETPQRIKYKAEWFQENKERIFKNKEKHKQENIPLWQDKNSKYCKRYYQNNKETIKEYKQIKYYSMKLTPQQRRYKTALMLCPECRGFGIIKTMDFFYKNSISYKYERCWMCNATGMKRGWTKIRDMSVEELEIEGF